MATRYVTGQTEQDTANPDIFYRTMAEAMEWDNEDVLVQLVKIETIGKNQDNQDVSTETGWNVTEMRISGNCPRLVLTTPYGEEAYHMWASMAFGV